MQYKNWAVEIHIAKDVFIHEFKEEDCARRCYARNESLVNDGVNQSPIDTIRLWNGARLIDKAL